jgi:hypothetical protein
MLQILKALSKPNKKYENTLNEPAVEQVLLQACQNSRLAVLFDVLCGLM